MFNYEDTSLENDSGKHMINNILFSCQYDNYKLDYVSSSVLIMKIKNEHDNLLNTMVDDQIIKENNNLICKEYIDNLEVIINERNEIYNNGLSAMIEITKSNILNKIGKLSE